MWLAALLARTARQAGSQSSSRVQALHLAPSSAHWTAPLCTWTHAASWSPASQQPSTAHASLTYSALQHTAQAWQGPCSAQARHLASSAGSDGPAGSSPPGQSSSSHESKPSLEAADLLQRVNVLQFRRQLESTTEDNAVITYPELLDMCQASGAASSIEEAGEVCRALLAASVVMRLGDLVYLRPYDVAELVVQALPGTEDKVRERLQQVQTALEPLDQEKSKLDRGANRVVRAILWAGLGGFIIQWGLFLRLTFWELSWDVMEPVTYFVSSSASIAIYCYFLWTDSEFSYKPWRTRLAAKLQANRYARQGFDVDRYATLQQDARRLERLLRRL